MANCSSDDHQNASKLHFEALQTVVPTTQTDPSHSSSHRVLITPSGISIFKKRFQTVMLYDATEDLSGWEVAGWMKESLCWALSGEPVLAGRLREAENRDDDNRTGDHLLEVIANDSGVRLLEATMDMELAEFLDHLKENARKEAELAFWEDIDGQNPQFCSLFYVQVTNFKCGGFSIGISCSLLMTDPFSITSFLNKWSNLHNKMISSGSATATRTPIFYIEHLRRTGSSPSLPTGTRPGETPGETVVFHTSRRETSEDSGEGIYKSLAALCICELSGSRSRRAPGNFLLLLKDYSSGNIKAETISGEEIDRQITPDNECKIASWDDLGVGKVQFCESVKANHVSTWISSVSGEGFVMIFPSSEDCLRMNILVTLPSEMDRVQGC